jgi:hypothetical protein
VSRYPEFDLSTLERHPIADRESKVSLADLGKPYRKGASFRAFADGLPDTLAARDLRLLARETARAAREKRAVAFLLGGHVVKTGTVPFLLQLLRAGVGSVVAMNGATAIHDFELAFWGRTSEDVGKALPEGRFGMAEETAVLMNRAVKEGSERREGLGEALGRTLLEGAAPHATESLLANAYGLGIPATVHVALGTDIVHMQPEADGAAYGDTSLRDFRILTQALTTLARGVLWNVGSAVLLPEVLLKALAVLSNRKIPTDGIVAADLDFIRHYRTSVNVLARPTAGGKGRAISLTGPHEILVPLLAALVLEEL